MSDTDVLQRVVRFLRETFPRSGDALTEDSQLRESVLIDSLASMELIVFLEQEFDIRLDRADLDAFGSPRSIADLVRKKQQAG